MQLSVALTSVLLWAATGAAPSRPREEPARGVRYAALPLRDHASSPGGRDVVQDRLVEALTGRGASFVDSEAVESVLHSRRVRYTDSLDAETARAMCALTGADYVLMGALLEYDPRVPPRVAISVRVLDGANGERVLSSLCSASGADFTGALAIGTIYEIDELTPEVIVRVLDAFGPDGGPLPAGEVEHELPSPRPGRSYIEFQSPEFDPTSVKRVAVMPLIDRTEASGAGLLLADIFSHVWFLGADVQVVELSELRQAMRLEGLRSIDELDFERMRAIAARVGTPFFQLGSVEVYQTDTPIDGEALPRAEVLVRILDVERERVVAGVGLSRQGDDYTTVLGLGTVRDPIELSRRTAAAAVALLVRTP